MKAFALALALYCPLPLAQDEPALIRCYQGECIVPEAELRRVLEVLQRLTKHVLELREMCGWREELEEQR